MTKLVLIRHGETEKNIPSILHRVDDPESLNEKGIRQMAVTALFLKKMNISVVYYSTEERAKQSGQILSQKLAVPLKKILGMQERDWGELSGKPWPEVEAILKPMTLNKRYTYVPPKGESWQKAEKRLKKAIDDVLAKYPNETVVIVSHGGAIRILMPYFLDAPIEETFKHSPDNASLTVFDYQNGRFFKKLVNDTSHLPADLKN